MTPNLSPHLTASPSRLASISQKFVLNYKRGSDYRWVACLCASRVVGTYEKNSTAELGRVLAVSASQIENLARAGVVYRELRRLAPDLPGLRRALTPSHFAALGDLMRKYDASPLAAVDALRDAAHSGLSVGEFRAVLDSEWGGYKPAWGGQVRKLAGALDRLVGDYDVPDGLRALAVGWRSELDNWLGVGSNPGGL